MCLDTVDKEIKKTKGFGWKVFDKENGELCASIQNSGPYPIGKWIEDEREGTLCFGTYPTGFHIWVTEAGATPWYHPPWNTLRKVEFADVVATGRQGYTRRASHVVIVARKIKILED